MRRLNLLILGTVFALAALLLIVGCNQDSPTATTPLAGAGDLVMGSPYSQTAGDCDTIGLHRAGIQVTVECLKTRLYVPAANADYVRVWESEVNERLVAEGPVNAWFEFTLPAGTHRLRLAVEKRKGDGNVWQCDRHKLELKTEPCTPPPPPPPPCPPVGEANCAEQTWDEGLCMWVGDCPPQCVAPAETSFELDKPIGNPSKECAYFGAYVPGSFAFVVVKCGKFYELHTHPFAGSKCSNGKDVSHTTECKCPTEDE